MLSVCATVYMQDVLYKCMYEHAPALEAAAQHPPLPQCSCLAMVPGLIVNIEYAT